jgi:acyl transferase domain-containing protein
MLSVKGRCNTFDAAADGFVRGEGCGMLVLKRLSDAISDRDPILALIRGSATNHSGHTSGLTVPNGTALAKVMRAALRSGGVEPEQVGYIEAHGTGTSIGDPIEMEAVGRVFGPGRSREAPILVGSVKTNIGHTEGAAGVAGLIKVVLAMQNEELPAHLNLEVPNPNIRWDELPVRVPRSRVAWPRGQRRRIAGVTTFAFNGANAHVLLEEAPAAEPRREEGAHPAQLLVLSARTQPALRELARRYVEAFSSSSVRRPPFLDACYTANTGRVAFPHRVAVVASSWEEAVSRLSGFLREEETPGVKAGSGRQRPRVAFVFGGAGTEPAGWGRGLFDSEPAFREAVVRCERALARPLVSALYPQGGGAPSPLAPSLALPGLLAMQCGLVHLWKAWGVEPSVVLGQGAGEYAAACAAGVLSWEEGVKLVAALGEQLEAEGKGAFATAARTVAWQRPRVPWVSTVTGRTLESVGAEYWLGQVGAPVRLDAALQALEEHGAGARLEIGLSGGGGREALLEALAGLVAAGVDVAWTEFYRDHLYEKVVLPTYGFQRSRYWFDPQPAPASKQAVPAELLGGDAEALAAKLEMIEQLSDEQARALLESLAAGGT